MSDPNVVNSEMNPSNLSDAEIESIISGAPVAGVPAHLSEFVALLGAEYDASPGVTPGLALADFLSAPSVAAGAPAAGASSVTSIFKKSTAVAGAVSFKLLLGAAAAAAGVGGAQAAGVIDLPGIGSEPTVVELPTDKGDGELGPPTSVTSGGSPSITVPPQGPSDVVSVPPFAELAKPQDSLQPYPCTPTQGPTHASSTSNPSEANRQASSACGGVGDGQGNGPAGGQNDGPANGDHDGSVDDQGEGQDGSDGDQGANDQGAEDQGANNQGESSGGRAGQGDDDQGQPSGSSNGDEDDLEPAKPAKSQKPESPSSSGPKKEK